MLKNQKGEPVTHLKLTAGVHGIRKSTLEALQLIIRFRLIHQSALDGGALVGATTSSLVMLPDWRQSTAQSPIPNEPGTTGSLRDPNQGNTPPSIAQSSKCLWNITIEMV